MPHSLMERIHLYPLSSLLLLVLCVQVQAATECDPNVQLPHCVVPGIPGVYATFNTAHRDLFTQAVFLPGCVAIQAACVVIRAGQIPSSNPVTASIDRFKNLLQDTIRCASADPALERPVPDIGPPPDSCYVDGVLQCVVSLDVGWVNRSFEAINKPQQIDINQPEDTLNVLMREAMRQIGCLGHLQALIPDAEKLRYTKSVAELDALFGRLLQNAQAVAQPPPSADAGPKVKTVQKIFPASGTCTTTGNMCCMFGCKKNVTEPVPTVNALCTEEMKNQVNADVRLAQAVFNTVVWVVELVADVFRAGLLIADTFLGAITSAFANTVDAWDILMLRVAQSFDLVLQWLKFHYIKECGADFPQW